MRRVLLDGLRGAGERFIWQGQTWEVLNVISRDEGSGHGFGARTLVTVTPTQAAPESRQPETPLRDFGEVHTPAGPEIGAPSTQPTTVQAAEAAAPAMPAAATPASTSGLAFNQPILNILGMAHAAANQPAAAAPATGGRSIEELTARCAGVGVASPDEQVAACTILTSVRQALGLDQQGRAADHSVEVAGMQEQGANARQQQSLQASAQSEGRKSAQDVTNQIATGLSAALTSIGEASPQLFLNAAQDPAALRDALLAALQSGQGIYPTMERQNLIANAAQNPTDIVRLLFLSGGQTPPATRTGAFNVQSVLQEGQRAREDLARQIASTPRVTFDDLLARFTPPVPPIGAAKGAIVEMRRNARGVYEAAAGASIVKGPALFTVGEKGTEFALLAPGSIIAPKASPDEPETMRNAVRAVAEIALHGKRQKPAAARKGTAVRRAQAGTQLGQAAQDIRYGGTPSDAALPMTVLESILQGASAAGAALQHPERSISERIRDFRLQLFPLPSTTFGQRATVLASSANDPFLQQILGLGLTNTALHPLGAAETQIEADRAQARQEVTDAMHTYFSATGQDFGALPKAQQDQLIEAQLRVHAPGLFPDRTQQQADFINSLIARSGSLTSNDAAVAAQLGLHGVADAVTQFAAGTMDQAGLTTALQGELQPQGDALQLLSRYMNGEQLKGIQASLDQDAPGSNLPFAAIQALPAGSRSAVMTVLGSIFGSDVIQNLVDLFTESRRQSFESGTARLGLTR